MTHNPMCDGSHCRHVNSPVKMYPLSQGTWGSNLILCMECWAHENKYRHTMGVHYKRPEDWPQLDWNKAEFYEGAN